MNLDRPIYLETPEDAGPAPATPSVVTELSTSWPVSTSQDSPADPGSVLDVGRGAAGRSTESSLLLGPHCPTAWPSCALGPHMEKTQSLGAAHQSVENHQVPKCSVIEGPSLLLRNEGTPDTVYASSWSKTPRVALGCSLRFDALSRVLLHPFSGRVCLESCWEVGAVIGPFHFGVSQFKSFPAPQSP